MPADIRSRAFIVSSTQSLDVAEAVKRRLEARSELIVDIWDEDMFRPNQGFLDELLNLAGYYDFVIAIFSADDESVIRENPVLTVRDNVIFEFGLFLGRLGLNRSFFIHEVGVELFSDWSGRGTISFERIAPLDSAVGSACSRIIREMHSAERLSDYNMLPSTALAIGYYTNFISRIYDAFAASPRLVVSRKDSSGDIIPGSETEYTVPGRLPVVHVRVPQRLRDLNRTSLKARMAGFQQVSVQAQSRNFPFYIDANFGDQENFVLFDVPTTLLSANFAIDKLFSPQFLARDNVRERLERREIQNFQQVLRKLLDDDIEERYFRFEDLDPIS